MHRNFPLSARHVLIPIIRPWQRRPAVRIAYGDPIDISTGVLSANRSPIRLACSSRRTRAAATSPPTPGGKIPPKPSATADRILVTRPPDFLTNMVEVTTAGNTSPCPACRDKGLRWLIMSGGASKTGSNHLPPVRHRLPNPNYPETVELTSTGPAPGLPVCRRPTFHCFGYRHSRPIQPASSAPANSTTSSTWWSRCPPPMPCTEILSMPPGARHPASLG